MTTNSRFWILLAAFQVAFGLLVFFVTREFYLQEAPSTVASQAVDEQAATEWPQNISERDVARLTAPAPSAASIEDPFELSRQADEAFNSKDFDRAAVLYEQMLIMKPGDVNVHNNLGITLHYLGQSAEAIRLLNAGLALNPEHQRSWLTLGFVNNQLGNAEQAREALTQASLVGNDESIRQSAVNMLAELP